jgi:redox-sensitive bicupin YhaK (pirin superfamily)
MSTSPHTSSPPAIDVRRAGSRFHTRLDWLDSWHSFSFGHHRDPANTHHGLLLVNNDDVVAAAGGFGPHPHRDMEIVTWVLEGELEHRDSAGNQGVIRPGLAQRMSAGRGITHSEMNASRDLPVHLVQMWVLPDVRDIDPGYEQRDIGDALASPELVPVASGRGHDGAVTIHQHEAVLWAARLGPGDAITVPDAPHVHVFVARGDAELDGAGALRPGDAVRLTDAGSLVLTATRSDVESSDPDPRDTRPQTTEILVWETA